jgi:hypothetical protein
MLFTSPYALRCLHTESRILQFARFPLNHERKERTNYDTISLTNRLKIEHQAMQKCVLFDSIFFILFISIICERNSRNNFTLTSKWNASNFETCAGLKGEKLESDHNCFVFIHKNARK